MSEKILDILTMVENKDISVSDAVTKIKEHEDRYIPYKPAKKFKIKIKTEDGKSINLPPIPLWLVSCFGGMGLRFAKIGIAHSDEIDETAKNSLKHLKPDDLKKLFDLLKNYGSFTMVDVYDEKENTEVLIKLI